MNPLIEELAKNVSELIKRYNRLKEENLNLLKKIKEKERDYQELKTKFDEIDTKRVKAIGMINKVISKIDQFIPEEKRAKEGKR